MKNITYLSREGIKCHLVEIGTKLKVIKPFYDYGVGYKPMDIIKIIGIGPNFNHSSKDYLVNIIRYNFTENKEKDFIKKILLWDFYIFLCCEFINLNKQIDFDFQET